MNNFDNYTIDEIRREIAGFKNDPDVLSLSRYYQAKSFSEILGVSRKELPHSRFIAWLLDANESHGLGFFPIKKLLDSIVLLSQPSVSVPNKGHFDAIITDDLNIVSVEIESEKSIGKHGRVDIYAKISLQGNPHIDTISIAVENKVTSLETNDQTQRYFEYFENNKDNRTLQLYVYLTPISTLELLELSEPLCTCKQFIQINYQSIVDMIIEPALNSDISNKTKNILTEYLQSLSQPSFNDDNEEHQEGLIMAIGTEERELLKKFWDKNQKLILASLYAMSSDPDQDKDIRDSISGALEQMSENTKDKSLVTIFFEEQPVIAPFKKAYIGLKTVLLIEEKGLLDHAAFEFLRADKSCSFNLIKSKDEVTPNEQKYHKYKVESSAELVYEGKEYYVARNWGIGNITKFIDNIHARFPQISFQINS